jgi:para-aminobenzoate synthetase
LFEALFGSDRFAFWIDRVWVPGGNASQSVMGSATGAGSETLTYEVARPYVTSTTPAGGEQALDGTIFDVLRGRLAERRVGEHPGFDFCAGYVGYLGYELKADLGSPGRHVSDLPDACLFFPGAMVVIDHPTGAARAIRVMGPGERLADAEADLQGMRDRSLTAGRGEAQGVPRGSSRRSRAAIDRGAYLSAIRRIQERLRVGESYEACLTNRFEIAEVGELDPLDLYLRLRELSPAPQAGYMRFGEAALLSASPEHFLRIGTDRRVTTRPIKGTRPRGDDPASDRAIREELRRDEKERAENVMIVDVVRNDLGRVCEFGSIEVEQLAAVETFAQVHQLVSTVSGRLAVGREPIDCVEACFPGGSMTGAPKLRAMEIIDSLEPCARGPYSGAFGWFGLDGAVDLSILIRSIVLCGDIARIGAGGAVTVLSEPDAEYAEMLLKARALLDLLGASRPGRR